MKRNILYLLLLSFGEIYSQVIDWNKFDQKLFNNKIIAEVKKERNSNISKYDSNCFKMADFHALYLSNTKMSFSNFSQKSDGTYGGHLEQNFAKTKSVKNRSVYSKFDTEFNSELCYMGTLKAALHTVS